ncbi:hypothetical protein [Micromonospora sp. NBC_00421]|uniref:hypothetical protein n=1 Tax=Micromonospora sp. NBC_00421 TaxID=2975976 RepID=UPI002E1A9A2D
MTDTTPAPSEAWKTPRHQVETGVKLADAPTIRAGGKTYRPYSITFDHRRTGNGPWRATLIAIYATKQYPGGGEALVGSCLHPGQLDDMPGWLADIIARAIPAEN